MVLVPEIVDAVGEQVPVLAAGGIGSGRQVAAALALGAAGAWTGSIWLTTAEYGLGAPEGGSTSAMQRALLAAGSSDTVRSRIYTGKPARLLRTRWTDAWAAPDAPKPLPMPLQNILVGEAHRRIAASDDPAVVSMPVGQIVGSMNTIRPVAEVMADLLAEFDRTVTRLVDLR
jgi:NAD(P)H-dependent flavin oxidoreductase YrpB (nitropropane dioxygenase family)